MKKIDKKNVFNVILVFLFMGLTFFLCQYHEPWYDESQAWLIARDNSIVELFTGILHYEGHPALWYLIIKLFQFLGLEYSSFYIIPWLFSSIGVCLFVFKSKYPWFIKILFTFSYFIFYQFTVISRSYCLILILFMLLNLYWEKRREKPFTNVLVLTLFISTSLYTFCIAGFLYILWMYDYYKERNDFKRNKKQLIAFGLIFLVFLITSLYIYPMSSSSSPMHRISYFLSDSFFTNRSWNNFFRTIFTFVIFGLIIKGYEGKNDKLIRFIILIMSLFLFYSYIYCMFWHVGILFILAFTLFEIDGLLKNKYIMSLITISLLFQVYYSIDSSIYDYKVKFSFGEDVAELIKKYDYKNLKIFGSEFASNMVNPYFDENIYDNYEDGKGHFILSYDAKYYDYDYEPEKIVKYDADIYVMMVSNTKKVYDVEEITNKYNAYEFISHHYFQNFNFDKMYSMVLVKKELDINEKE